MTRIIGTIRAGRDEVVGGRRDVADVDEALGVAGEAMQQVEDGIVPRRIEVVARRQVDKDTVSEAAERHRREA